MAEPAAEADRLNTERRWGLRLAIASGLAFVALAALLVPWNPVPGGMPEPVSAREVFTAGQIDKAEAFARTSRLLSWSSLALSLVIICVLGFTKMGRRLVDRLPGPWWVKVVLAVAAVELLIRSATLPFAALLHWHYAEAGLSTQSWGSWALDVLKSQSLTIVVLSVVLLVIIGAARRWHRGWPVIVGLVLAALVFAGSFAYPLVVEPMFNSFRPMDRGELRSEIIRLAETEDVDVDEVLVADASRRTTTLNAYVSGLWGSRRVVVYDNLLQDLQPNQVLSVVAHELAHAQNDDVLVGTTLGAAGTLFAIGLLAVLMGPRARRAEAVPLVLALIAVGSLLASPVESIISRRIETRADVEALEATRDRVAFENVQVRLAERSLADPTPPWWAHTWFDSHPTVLERVALAHGPQS